MHYSSLYDCKDFKREYLDKSQKKKIKILEVGSLVMSKNSDPLSGSFRRYFKDPRFEYIGVDIKAGPGVDVVSDNLYKYPFEDNSFDVVLSGSTLEHVEDTHKWIREIARVTNDLVWILVPNFCKEHRHPVDCWRILPDGMRFLLATIADMEVLYSEKSERHSEDTIGIAKKL